MSELTDRIKRESSLVWATAETDQDILAAYLAGRMDQRIEDLPPNGWSLDRWYAWYKDKIQDHIFNDY